MGISTVSFNQAKIYKNKMIFTLYCKDGVYTRVLDERGKNLFNRISHKAIKSLKNDYVVISRRNEYELPDRSIVLEFIERMYNKAGNLLSVEKRTVTQ